MPVPLGQSGLRCQAGEIGIQHVACSNAPRSYDRGYYARVASVVRRGGDRQTCWFYLAVCAKKIILPPPTAGPANEFPGPQPFGNH